jgi:hypothetical protein
MLTTILTALTVIGTGFLFWDEYKRYAKADDPNGWDGVTRAYLPNGRSEGYDARGNLISTSTKGITMIDKPIEQHTQIINSTINTDTVMGIDPEFGVSFEPDAILTEIGEMLATDNEENSPYVFWSNRLKKNQNTEEFVDACREMVLDHQLWQVFSQVVHDYLSFAQKKILNDELPCYNE